MRPGQNQYYNIVNSLVQHKKYLLINDATGFEESFLSLETFKWHLECHLSGCVEEILDCVGDETKWLSSIIT